MVYRSPHDSQDIGDQHNGSRVCGACGERKDINKFGWSSGHRYRKRTCTTCLLAKQKQRVAADPEYYRALGFAQNLKQNYGLTVDRYNEIMTAQDGRCGICREEFTGRPHVDHDHATGQVRGILCFTCNTALGKFKDSVELLRSAISYLEKPR